MSCCNVRNWTLERIKRDVIAQGQVLWPKEANGDQRQNRGVQKRVLWFERTDRDKERQLRSGSGQQVPTLETSRSLLGTCWRMQLHKEQGVVGHEMWELPSDQAREKMGSGLRGRLQGPVQGTLRPWPFLSPVLFTPAEGPSPRRTSLAWKPVIYTGARPYVHCYIQYYSDCHCLPRDSFHLGGHVTSAKMGFMGEPSSHAARLW